MSSKKKKKWPCKIAFKYPTKQMCKSILELRKPLLLHVWIIYENIFLKKGYFPSLWVILIIPSLKIRLYMNMKQYFSSDYLSVSFDVKRYFYNTSRTRSILNGKRLVGFFPHMQCLKIRQTLSIESIKRWHHVETLVPNG